MNINKNSISIRTITENDMSFIQTLWGDEESMLSAGGVYTIKDEDKDVMFQILNNGDDVNNHYIIFYEDQAIGDMIIRKFDDRKTAHMDMKIFHPERNKGYGKLALQILLDHYFNVLGGEEIFFEIWLVNYFAIQKLKDYGFEATLVMEDATIMTLIKENYLGGPLNV